MAEIMKSDQFTIVHAEWVETKLEAVADSIRTAENLEKEKRRITIKEIISAWEMKIVVYQNEVLSKNNWEEEKYLEAFVFDNEWKAIFSIYVDAD